MKEHLINLLMQEYMQQALFDGFERAGIQLDSVCVANRKIILDMIGFPKDNTSEYDLYDEGDESKKIPDDKMFSREWLSRRYWESTEIPLESQRVIGSGKGLKIVEGEGLDEQSVFELLTEHIEWLYEEFGKYERDPNYYNQLPTVGYRIIK